MPFVLPPLQEHLYELETMSLHAQVWGKDSPITVVFEAGLGGFSLHWLKVAEALAKQVRVFVYDRAGYGFSTASPQPVSRTSHQLAQELHQLLQLANVPPPYLIVGHSFGGFIARAFAARYSDEVAAVLLVDAVHEHEWSPRFPLSYRMADRALVSVFAVLSKLSSWGLLAWLAPFLVGNSRKLPAAVRVLASRLMLQAQSLDAVKRELAAMPESAMQAQALSFPPVPLTVLGRGQTLRLFGLRLLPDKLEQRLRIQQRYLAKLSPLSRRRTVKSSQHDIHLEAPERVMLAVERLLEKVGLVS